MRAVARIMYPGNRPPKMTPQQRRENRMKRQGGRVRLRVERAMRLVVGNDMRPTDPIPSRDKVLKIWQVLGLEYDLFEVIEGGEYPINAENCGELGDQLVLLLSAEYLVRDVKKRSRKNPWRLISREEFEAAVARGVATSRKMMGLDAEVPEGV